MIGANVELPDLLRHLIEEACSLVDARYGALGVLNETRTALQQFITVGLSEEEEMEIGPRPTGRGVLGLLITEPGPLRLADLSTHHDSYGFPANHPPMRSFLGLPVRIRGEVYGNLYLTDKQGADEFSEEDEAMAEGLALAAGIALENTRLHDAVKELSLMEDRDRIARDLHDRVIQRIFAVGMSLQSVSHLPGPPQILDRVNKAVDDLDITIDQIRSSIFDLESSMGQIGLRRSILDMANDLAPLLGARPQVIFNGPVDSRVSQQAADHVLAVVREALTNAGKHARATEFSVTISVDDDLCLEVVDNGRGTQPSKKPGSGRGLKNIRGRAEKLGGSLTIETPDGGGTRVLWKVPC
jgi:signal transduction histidine kinase